MHQYKLTCSVIIAGVLLVMMVTMSCSAKHAASSDVAVKAQGLDARSLGSLAQNMSQLSNQAIMTLPPIFLNQIRTNGSQYQKNLVKDGSLTLAEYEKAELAYASCMKAAGFRIHPGSTKLTGLDRIAVTVGPYRSFAAEQKAEASCRGKYTSDIDQAWAWLTGAIDVRVRNEARQSMASCIKAAGLAPGAGWTLSGPPVSDGQAFTKFQSCEEQVSAKYNIDSYFGFDGDQQLLPKPPTVRGQ